MSTPSAKKLGKLSLAILENFVKSSLGEGFVEELRGDYDKAEDVRDALGETEERFLIEFPDKDLSRAMFVDLSQKDRPSLAEAVKKFYEHPTDPQFENVLSDLLLGEFEFLKPDQVQKAVKFYVKILTEELAMIDAEFRGKVAFLIDYRRLTETEKPKARGTSGKRKTASPIFQVPPLPAQGVFGRDNDLHRIAEFIMPENTENESLPPVSLLGMGGIGKTTLAIAFAHRPDVQAWFKDGVLWTSLGLKPTVRLLLDAWGRALGIDLQPERDEEACQKRLRQVLHDRQMLIIVDDVWDTIQGNYFKIGGDRCRILYTTRESPIANGLAMRERTLRVDVLQPEAAIHLLHKLAPDTRAVSEEIARRLCERLEFLPLGITLAGRMLANEADVPTRMQRLLGELIERRDARLSLIQEEGRKDLDEENPVSLQAILGMSIERLSKEDQARFAMLSVFGGEPLTWEVNAVSAVWECSIEDTEATVSRFVQRGLVEPRRERYWMHALLADYAAEMMESMDL